MKLVFATLGVIVACAPVAAHASPRTPPTLSCARIASIRAANVERVGTAPGGRRRFLVPARVRVADARRARALARAICRLPAFTRGVHACPADFSLRYEIAFGGATGRVDVDPFGCESVIGAGPRRWAALSARFWRVFGAAVGRPHATAATFRGRPA